MSQTLGERLLLKYWNSIAFIPFHECWEWEGNRTSNGYGRMHVSEAGKPREIGAHRFSYELHFGPIPVVDDDNRKVVVRHKCDNPGCVRPEHLELGNTSQNMLDCSSRGRHPEKNKTHCPHGHEYNEVNTYIRPNGHRKCRVCNTLRERRKLSENITF